MLLVAETCPNVLHTCYTCAHSNRAYASALFDTDRDQVPVDCGIDDAENVTARYDVRNIHFSQGYAGHGRPWEFGVTEGWVSGLPAQ